MRIYTRYFPASLKTDTNEIAYWADHYAECFEDQFLPFGFYVNQALIGYAQMAYFLKERLLVIDYLVVEKSHRRPNIFLEFVEHLRTTIDRLGLEVDYVVAEVGLQSHNGIDRIDPHTRALLRLLKSVGFGVAKAPYIQPQLGLTNKESRTPAALVIDTRERSAVRQIQRETYLGIVRTIYFKHYLRWYSIYADEKIQYNRHVSELFEEIVSKIPDGAVIAINGFPRLNSGPSVSVQVVDTELTRFVRTALVAFGILGALCAVTGLVLLIKLVTDVSYRTLVVVFALVLFAFFALLTPFYPSAERVLDHLVSIMPFLAQPNRVARHRRKPGKITRRSVQRSAKRRDPLGPSNPKEERRQQVERHPTTQD